MGSHAKPSGLEPMALGLTLCDAFRRDPRTGKFTLTGIFFQFAAPRFPTIHPMCLYACMSDGRGRTKIQVRLIDVNEEEPPIWDHQVEVDFEAPDLVIEFGIEEPDARIPHPGRYLLQLMAAGATIMERSIYASLTSTG